MQSPSSSLASSRHAAAAATEDEVRLSYWLQEWGDEPPHPDTSSCLLHQKLQVLQACIHRRRANKALQLTLQHSEDEADQWNAAWDDQSGTPLATKGAARNEKSGKMSTRSKTGKKGGLGGKSTMKSPLAKRKLAMEESNLNPLDAVDYTHKESSPIKQDPDQLEMGEGEHGEEEEEDEEGEGDYCSASEDEDFVQGKPRGSLGPLLDDQGLPIALIQHPERSIRVPLFQFPMIWSSDRWRERSHFVHTSRDELLSYMSCFKAANPGCILDDYLRFLNEGKGEREGETEEENGGREVWYGQVWASAPPLAAWEQKKLQNPDQEGERVLHELETMNPSDLFTQLLTLSLSSSLDLLHQSACLVQRQDRAGGAEESFGKPPAIILDLITRYQAMSQSLISAGCSLVDPDRSSSSDGPTSNSSSSSHHGGDSTGGMLSRRHSLLTGHDPQVLELLIAELGPIERAIVLYQSITRRLPGCDQLCSKILRAVLEGARDDQDQDEDLDDEPAMERRRMSKVMSGRRSFASISSLESRLAIASLVSSRSHSYSDEDNEENDEEGEEEEKGKESRPSLLDEQDARLVLGSGGGRGGGHEGKDAREERYKGLFSRLFEPSWPRQPGQREWVYDVMQVEKEDLGEELAKEGDAYAYGSRMYLQHNRPGDLRLSLILCTYA